MATEVGRKRKPLHKPRLNHQPLFNHRLNVVAGAALWSQPQPPLLFFTSGLRGLENTTTTYCLDFAFYYLPPPSLSSQNVTS